MAVNLSPVGGVAAQFFTNTGAVLTGGKLFTYLAGTTTPATAYTSSQGNVAWTNPIVLDAAGRVSGSGEIWLTQNTIYKFALKDANDVLIGTYDNISGISSFTLPISSTNVTYTPAGGGAVDTTVQAKLRESVSVLDFGADPTGVTSSSTAIANAIASLPSGGGVITFPPGTYLGRININRSNVKIDGFGATLVSDGTNPAIKIQLVGDTIVNVCVYGLTVNGVNTATHGVRIVRGTRIMIDNLFIKNFNDHGVYITGDGAGSVTQIQVQMCRIDAGNAPAAGTAGIRIGDGGVATTVRLLNNYITSYPISIRDAGVNTVGLGNIYEYAANAVINAGGASVYIGDWVESATMSTTNYYVIEDGRTTIISPHNCNIANIAQGAVGQFPNNQNRIFVEDLVALGPTMIIDGGFQGYQTAVGGSVLADAPKNLRGLVQITDTNTSATVTFSSAEPNATYYIVATPVSVTGTPATGSNRVTTISKSTTGFTINVEVAPGSTNSVTFNWIMVR